MLVSNKKVTILVSVILFLTLAEKSTQDFSWKNNRIVKQDSLGGYGNIPSAHPQPQPQPQQPASQEPQFVPTVQEQTISGISFDCTGKPTGPNKDTQYCDIYHACVFGKQQKTYGCAQNGERFYYDEKTQKCEFASKNPSGCSSGSYYTPLTPSAQNGGGYGNQQLPQPIPSNNGNNGYNNYQQPSFPVHPTQAPQPFAPQTTGQVPFNPYGNQNNFGNNNNNNQPQEEVEPWKLYVRQNEQFACSDKSDGFYASKWCNVYYRCFNKIKYEFLCAVMQSGERLWWMSHSTSQSVPQPQAQCQWPCDIGRPCSSPGGILKVNGNSVSDSTSDAQRILDACPKPNSNNQNNNNGGYAQPSNGGNNGGYAQPSNGGNNGGYAQPSNGGNNGGYAQPSNGGNNGGYAQPSNGGNNGGFGSYGSNSNYNSYPSQGGNGGNGGNGQTGEDNSNDLFRIPDSDNVCQGVSDGSFVSNPKYCNVFHVCVKGVRKDFLCAKGSSTYDLWWNDATRQCEWPCKLQCSKQIFGSSSSAAEIATMDRNLNPALCGGNSNGNNGGNNGGFGGYGQFTQPIQTHPPMTQAPATQPANNYNNNYGSGYGNNNNNNFVTIPAGSYGK